MPNRYLRDGILTSERINTLSPPCELFYRRLMSVVDDWGLYDGRLGVIRASCYPLQLDKIREADISRWIAECEKAGLLVLYKVSDKPYLWMTNTKSLRRSKPKYPPPARSCLQLRANAPDYDFDCDFDYDPPKPPVERGAERGSGESGRSKSGRNPKRVDAIEERCKQNREKLEAVHESNGS